MARTRLTLQHRFQWLVALVAVVIVVYLLLPLWATVVAVAFVVAFALPPLLRPRRR